MGLSGTTLGVIALALLLGCGGECEEPDRVVVVSAHGSESNTQSSGGTTVVVVSYDLKTDSTAWTFAEPEAREGRVPPVSLVAVGDAMFRAGPDDEVIDALRTQRGTVALVREPAGKLFLCHYGEEEAVATPAPDGARRVLRGTDDPFTVRLLVADDLSVTATRIE